MAIKIAERLVAKASDKPDLATLKAPDWTAQEAPDRAFFINFGLFKYGTSDKAHGAAVLLFVLLLFVIIALIFFGHKIGLDPEWRDRVFTWLGSAFLFVAGAAVGRSSKTENDKNA